MSLVQRADKTREMKGEGERTEELLNNFALSAQKRRVEKSIDRSRTKTGRGGGPPPKKKAFSSLILNIITKIEPIIDQMEIRRIFTATVHR